MRYRRPRPETTIVLGSAVTASVEKVALPAFFLRHVISLFLSRSEVGFIVDKAFHEFEVNADYRFFKLCPLAFFSDFLLDDFR